jgi:hypothetical protein
MKTKILILLTLSLATTAVFSQQKKMVTVHLKNDSIVRGRIIERKPKYLLINGTEDNIGIFYKVQKDEIEKITKDEIFHKKMYLNINGAYHFIDLFDGFWDESAYSIDLEFERQFSKHWGYTAGLGFFLGLYDRSYYYTYLELPVAMKFYSKIINVSMGTNMRLFLRNWNFDSPEMFGFETFLTISKDFTVFRNFKMEPYIQAYLMLMPDIWGYPSIGLRLKYEFNDRPKRKE